MRRQVHRSRRIRRRRRPALRADPPPQDPHVLRERRHVRTAACRLSAELVRAMRLRIDPQPHQDDRAREGGEHRGEYERAPAADDERLCVASTHVG
ncbi:hypothetical protein [Streptomyces sp. NPDC002790]|uniref:hypothetical protein n=1 Tax=Streptomyces sp. NPDC002790 TaxID=3154431 RepID=UPI003325B9C6